MFQKLHTTMFVIAISMAAAISYTCKDPENAEEIIDELSKDIEKRFKNDLTYFVMPEFSDNIAQRVTEENEEKFGTQFKELLRNSIQRYQTPLHGESKCDRRSLRRQISGKTNDIGSGVDQISTCPWRIVLDADENRVPKSISMAVCTCRECRSSRSGNRCPGHLCQEVVNRMPVIRRLCYNGVYNYTTHIESVPIGCTCARPKNTGTRSRRSC